MRTDLDPFREGLRPVKRLLVSDWADANRILSPIAASEPGRWRTNRTPYLRKPMDCLSSYMSYEKVVFMKGAQIGATESANNWIGYIIDNAPGPTLMVQPTDDTAKRNSKMRIGTMIESCTALRDKVAKQKSRDGENTILQKNFPGGTLLMAGANSPSSLRSIPIKNLLLDEVDAYPYDLDGEGSPIDLATARTRTFARRKIFIISTPTIKGNSAIDREFEQTDQNYFFVPCPHCDNMHILQFENLKWDEGKPKTAQMVCPECGGFIDERFKTQMLDRGEWRPTRPDQASADIIGFHLSSFYSPYGWYSWAEIAADFIKASKDPAKMTTFVNTVLGEPQAETGEAPEWEKVYNRREDYKAGTVPADVCFLTCGVDIQKTWIELEIVGWCADKQSYSIDHRKLLGETILPDVWNELAGVVDETWTRTDGAEFSLSKMAIDTGYRTSEVHDFCRRFPNQVIPIKGSDKQEMAITPPKQIDYNKHGKKIGKMKQWNVGVSQLKKELYSWLGIDRPDEGQPYPPCFCHFPQYDESYFRGLTAEKYIEKKRMWVKYYERNEPLDIRIYARAAASICGLDRKKPAELKTIGRISERKAEVKKVETKQNGFAGGSFWQ